MDEGPNLFGNTTSGGVENPDLFADQSNIGQGRTPTPKEPPRAPNDANAALLGQLEMAEIQYAHTREGPARRALGEKIQQLNKALGRNEPYREGERVLPAEGELLRRIGPPS